MELEIGFSESTLLSRPIDLLAFEQWVRAKYSASYRNNIICNVRRYHHLLKADSNLRTIELLNNYVKNNVIKSLLILAKYNGCYLQFKDRLKAHGIKASRADSLSAFLRILNASNSDIIHYYNELMLILRANEQLFVKFLLHSGLRVGEGIASFNLIIELAKSNRLTDYYNNEWNCLMHFKYPKQFIRHTKNCYLTFITKDFLTQIINSQPITYYTIKNRIQRNNKSLRLDEFRDYFGTHLINNGILEAEQNLVYGRIPVSIFIRHYWSPKLKELGIRVFKALETIN